MYMSSQLSGWPNPRPGILKRTWLQPEFSIMALGDPDASSTTQMPSIQSNKTSPRNTEVRLEAVDEKPAAKLLRLRPLCAYESGQINLEAMQTIFASHSETNGQHLDVRWSLAAQAILDYPALRARFSPFKSQSALVGRDLMEPYVEDFIVGSVQDWANDELLRDMSGFTMGVVL